MAQEQAIDRKKKYWIKPGIYCRHLYNNTHIVMMVDRIERYHQDVQDRDVPKHRIEGVWCSWIDANNVEQRRMFKTDQLVEVTKK